MIRPTTTTRATATARRLAASIRGAIEDGRRGWRALTPARRATTVILGAMIVAGVGLRLWDIGAPPRFTFDEHHFIPNARHYLLGQPDVNDHPPLGKLFIAAGMLLFGDNPTGWRAASLILGLQTLVVAATLARALFGARRAAWFAAAFFAGDGFFVA
jgi:dolichyl-phosphate-mannose--protein O-mannosyl transferase